MIGISVNKNIEDYKDDFYKGMTFRQSIYSVLTLFSGAGVFFLTYSFFHLPQMPSIYLTILAAMPFAVVGFAKKQGMPLLKYLKKKREVKAQAGLLYQCNMDYEQEQVPVVLRKSLAIAAARFFVRIKRKTYFKMEAPSSVSIEEARRWIEQ